MADPNIPRLIDAINYLSDMIADLIKVQSKPEPAQRQPIKRYTSDEMMRMKIVRMLETGPKTVGIICNRLRAHSPDDVCRYLSEMTQDGQLELVSRYHPINGKRTDVYGVAAVLNRPHGPEGDE